MKRGCKCECVCPPKPKKRQPLAPPSNRRIVRVKVAAAEVKDRPGGRGPFLNLSLKVLGTRDEYVFDNLVDTPAASWRVTQYLKAICTEEELRLLDGWIGIERLGEMLTGKKLWINIRFHEHTGGPWPAFWRVSEVLSGD